MNGVTLDSGGLIALDRDNRRVVLLVTRVLESGMRVTVPATALAQVIRQPARQARLARFIRQPETSVVPLTAQDATEIGLLLARSRTSDIVDAHVVVCARRADQTIVTSDAGDLKRLDPEIELLAV